MCTQEQPPKCQIGKTILVRVRVTLLFVEERPRVPSPRHVAPRHAGASRHVNLNAMHCRTLWIGRIMDQYTAVFRSFARSLQLVVGADAEADVQARIRLDMSRLKGIKGRGISEGID